ncbi:Pimeloyl-ACP methyl ester carboxylesterase [Agrococcus baldri]|uniref:Pimeloyl-ACP methyl ester carboxylesterase n=1 Tax=Agrococcus baldri TaxID=153730 RepID=A0AA94HKB2_9MICO|nr:alpha/beta hydrolase [Agrococcus baldri]SFR98922.1 Pimeloyl-ACP methyl ester carboxylesterase [Agrococcus baldri]
MTTILDGIDAQVVQTDRLSASVLRRTPEGATGAPVVLIHGNVSSSLFWQPLMLALPRPTIAIDLRGFGDSETLPVDATRGLRDFSDDVASVLDALGVSGAHVVGWSMGGGVVMQLLLDRPDLVRSLTLQAPVPPQGFGTRLDGSLCTPDAAGTGGGGANADFVARLAAGDTSADEQTSPRSVYRASYVAPGFSDEQEDLWVESMLSTKTGEDNYPGDGIATESWPGFAAGDRGILNTMSAKHLDLTGIVDVAEKPAILWVRGAHDVIVGDESFFDFHTLGKHGIVPGWPGEEAAPPQQMIAQTRAVLDAYAANGGSYQEAVFEGAGHSPHLEDPHRFRTLLQQHIEAHDPS